MTSYLKEKTNSKPDDLEPIRTSLELRGIIEEYAGSQAAKQVVAGASTDLLLNAFAQMARALHENNIDLFESADRDIHHAILLLSNVPGIVQTWNTIFSVTNSFRANTLRHCWPDLEILLEAHRHLVDAICEGKEKLSAKLAREHIQPIWGRIHEIYSKDIYLETHLERIVTYLQFHYDEKVTLATLARDIVPISPEHIRYLFREELETTFTTWLRELRMKKAAELLKKRTYSIAQIATLVGYTDPSRFADHFRTVYKMTPSEYRKFFGK